MSYFFGDLHILLISGPSNSGKSILANYIHTTNKDKVLHLSFSKLLKELVLAVLNNSPYKLYPKFSIDLFENKQTLFKPFHDNQLISNIQLVINKSYKLDDFEIGLLGLISTPNDILNFFDHYFKKVNGLNFFTEQLLLKIKRNGFVSSSVNLIIIDDYLYSEQFNLFKTITTIAKKRVHLHTLFLIPIPINNKLILNLLPYNTNSNDIVVYVPHFNHNIGYNLFNLVKPHFNFI